MVFRSRAGSAYEQGPPSEAEPSSDGIPVLPPQVEGVADVTQFEAQQNGCSERKFSIREPDARSSSSLSSQQDLH